MDENAIRAIFEPVARVSKDMIEAAGIGGPGGITDNEVRYIVDYYYQKQKERIGMGNRLKQLQRDALDSGKHPEPCRGLKLFFAQDDVIERNVKRALGWYVEGHDMAWFFAQTIGVGPVLSAGLLAHIDIHKAPTCGHIWNFAGLNPEITWEKGKRRPWNAQLKTICWKLGESFAIQSWRPECFYGRVYKERKALEVARNESGAFQEQAKRKLETTRIGEDKGAYQCYSKGILPPKHLDQRARRYAVKLFLSHLHECWYRREIGEPPKPFVIAHLGHAHYIPPPQIDPTAECNYGSARP